MKQQDIERVMAAAWAVATGAPLHPAATLEEMRRQFAEVLAEVDPTGAYRPNSPTAGDLEETQDIPLRACPSIEPHPRRIPNPGERKNPPLSGPSRSPWPPRLISANEAATHD